MRSSKVLRFTGLLCVLLWFPIGSSVRAACVLDVPPQTADGTLWRHLGRDCSQAEREDLSISAQEVLAAFKDGRGVDLVGVVVIGDVNLEQLPEVPVSELQIDSPHLRRRIQERNLKAVRVIAGPLSIRDSMVRGFFGWAGKGLIVVKGPVRMTGTTFERPVDLSRAAFLGPVDFSEAVFLREAFFIEDQFERPVRFEKTAFGPHSRFFRAVFGDSVTFLRAGFNGLAEFIEVTFDKEASFSRSYFKMGTGFSGSRFRGPLDFSEAMFEREVYFLFTVFEGDAYFRRSTFRGEADFSDAQFKAGDDFSKVFFNLDPRFVRTKFSGGPPSVGLQDARTLYLIAAILMAFTLFFVFILRRQ